MRMFWGMIGQWLIGFMLRERESEALGAGSPFSSLFFCAGDWILNACLLMQFISMSGFSWSHGKGCRHKGLV